MNNLRIAIFLAVSALAPAAWAETFAISYEDRESIDPAEGFEEDCLGKTEADDCPARAAALQAELVELLGALDLRADTETNSIFQAMVAIDDPRLQAMGLRHFARRGPPPSLMSTVREFFFGPDPVVGHPSAELLAQSIEDVDAELSRLYLEGRPVRSYGGDLPSGSGETDSWAEARANDVELETIARFPEADRYPNAPRLLMLDRFVTDPLGGDPLTRIPVTGFVTEDALEDVEEHFRSVFGRDPHPSLAASRERYDELVAELAALQKRLQGGDFSVGERLEEITAELETVQYAMLAGTRLNLEAIEAADHGFWIEGASEDDPFSGALSRAVVVGIDPRLEQTVIRYLSTPGETGGETPTGGGSGDAGAPGDGGTLGNGGTPGRGGKPNGGDGSGNASGDGNEPGTDDDGDDGCGCSVPGAGGPSGALVALLAAFGLRRRKIARAARFPIR